MNSLEKLRIYRKELDQVISTVDRMHNAAIDEKDYKTQELCSQAMNALLEIDGPSPDQIGRLIQENYDNPIAVDALAKVVRVV